MAVSCVLVQSLWLKKKIFKACIFHTISTGSAGVCVCVFTHVFPTDLFLSELHLYQRSDCGQELPPWPVFDTTILFNILLDTADGQILDLSNTHATTLVRGRTQSSQLILLQYTKRRSRGFSMCWCVYTETVRKPFYIVNSWHLISR